MDLHPAYQVISSRWTRAFMLFKRHTQTPEEELQQEDRRAIEDQFDVFLSEVNVL